MNDRNIVHPDANPYFCPKMFLSKKPLFPFSGQGTVRCFGALCFMALGVVPLKAEERIAMNVDGKELVFYQAEPMADPQGGDRFKGSNFIHPIKTPSGFVVSDSQPADHRHHFGLWWPWKYVKVGERKVLCWELQKGDGLIQAVKHERIPDGLLTESVYIDRKAPGGPVELLQETTRITTSPLVENPAKGYFLDLEIVHRCAGDEPVTVTPYRYSGFAFRGADVWSKDNSTILTSERKDRDAANSMPARWVRVQGATDEGGQAGVLLMSRPDNRSHPEKLRTWDKQHGGAVFINFNTVMDEAWTFEPGQSYPRNFRLFVYDGTVTTEQAENLWEDYAEGVRHERPTANSQGATWTLNVGSSNNLPRYGKLRMEDSPTLGSSKLSRQSSTDL